MSVRIVIFASGSGTNAENIIRYFEHHPEIKIDAVYCNVADAGVIDRIEPYNVPSVVFSRDRLQSGKLTEELQQRRVNLIVLAGFLWLIPKNMVNAFKDSIINIHPALLPKYGGKGMYGMNVHQAVVDASESESGITIHLVNDRYDEGEILFQAKTKLDPHDSPKDVASKIHRLEHAHFPKVIEKYVYRKFFRA